MSFDLAFHQCCQGGGSLGVGLQACPGKPYDSCTLNLDNTLKRCLRQRSAVESKTGHLKVDGQLGRGFIKGTMGDAINVFLCNPGHNSRKILARISPLCLNIW